MSNFLKVELSKVIKDYQKYYKIDKFVLKVDNKYNTDFKKEEYIGLQDEIIYLIYNGKIYEYKYEINKLYTEEEIEEFKSVLDNIHKKYLEVKAKHDIMNWSGEETLTFTDDISDIKLEENYDVWCRVRESDNW